MTRPLTRFADVVHLSTSRLADLAADGDCQAFTGYDRSFERFASI
jgi:hypothetical protein